MKFAFLDPLNLIKFQVKVFLKVLSCLCSSYTISTLKNNQSKLPKRSHKKHYIYFTVNINAVHKGNMLLENTLGFVLLQCSKAEWRRESFVVNSEGGGGEGRK